MTILNVKNIYYKVCNDTILNDVSFQVNEGDCISIVGPSGSGKSTLLKLCADLIPISEGEIIYRNRSYEDYDPLILRKKISYCVQIPYIFGNTVFDNLAFPFTIRKENVDKGRIIELLKIFNMDESFINKNINSLSGGEKQRICIIRSLIYTPDILMLDEATSALDQENAKVVEKYIEKINKQGTTVLWITHNVEQSTRIFNKRLSMESGMIKKLEEF